MWNSPEASLDPDRSLLLRTHFRARQCALEERLAGLDRELDERHRTAARERVAGDGPFPHDRVTAELQEEHDEVAIELAYVRLARQEIEHEFTEMAKGAPGARVVA